MSDTNTGDECCRPRAFLIIRVKMASKRPKVDFSPEVILREICDGKELFNSINSLKSNLSVKRVSELLRLRRKENDIDAASLLALMFGFDTVSWVMAAIQRTSSIF